MEKVCNLFSSCFQAFVFVRSWYGFCEMLHSVVGFFAWPKNPVRFDLQPNQNEVKKEGAHSFPYTLI